MGKCLVCGQKLKTTEEDFCESCLTFLGWKYGPKSPAQVEMFRNYFLKSDSTKFRRKK